MVATVSVRYIVDDVDTAILFYRQHVGFHEVMHPAPSFAMLTQDDLRLVLTALGGIHFRPPKNDLAAGVGREQILLADPSGNPVELFEPTRPEAALARPS